MPLLGDGGGLDDGHPDGAVEAVAGVLRHHAKVQVGVGHALGAAAVHGSAQSLAGHVGQAVGDHILLRPGGIQLLAGGGAREEPQAQLPPA